MIHAKKAKSPAPVAAATQQLATYVPPTYHPDGDKKALHALTAQLDALAESSFVTLKMYVEAASVELEKRMQAVCEYHFSDDPEIKPELERLRPGIGNRDTANDLLGYARIYDLRPDVVKTDTKNCRPDDAAKARELAGKIIQALSAAMTPKSARRLRSVCAGVDMAQPRV